MKVTTDPKRFDEAVAAMRHRLSDAGHPVDVHRLAQDLEIQARILGATAQLDMATEIWTALEDAVANGQSFSDFQAAVSDRIRKAWGLSGIEANASRLDLVFRTNVQRAYTAGRVAQYSEPEVMATRPYWKFSAIMDSRTSPICQECAGTVLPADSSWWNSHQPPLHFRCRSTIIALTERAAKTVGIDKAGPKVKPDEGFGSSTRQFRPRLSEYPRPLAKAYKGPR